MLKILNDKCDPTRGSRYSAAIDLRSSCSLVIEKNKTGLVKLGVSISQDDILNSFILKIVSEKKISPTEKEKRVKELSEVFSREKEEEACPHLLVEQRAEVLRAYKTFMSTHYLQLTPRSGVAKKGLIIPNGVGIIDMDYENEIMLLLHNVSGKDFFIEEGDRVGQMLILEHKTELFNIVTEDQRKGGFGSTGER